MGDGYRPCAPRLYKGLKVARALEIAPTITHRSSASSNFSLSSEFKVNPFQHHVSSQLRYQPSTAISRPQRLLTPRSGQGILGIGGIPEGGSKVKKRIIPLSNETSTEVAHRRCFDARSRRRRQDLACADSRREDDRHLNGTQQSCLRAGHQHRLSMLAFAEGDASVHSSGAHSRCPRTGDQQRAPALAYAHLDIDIHRAGRSPLSLETRVRNAERLVTEVGSDATPSNSDTDSEDEA